MSGFDFDDIVALWTEPDADERAMIQEMARKTRRQARFLGYLDALLALLIIGLGIGGMMVRPTPMVVLVGVLMIALTLWINWKRRAFRRMSRTLDTGDRRAFLESGIRSATANLRRVTLSLVAFPPVICVAILYRISARMDPEFERPLEAVAEWATSPRGIIVFTILILLAGWTLRARLRAKAELRRWIEVRDAYEEEARRAEAHGA